MRNTDAVNIMMLNLLDSHDTYRFVTQSKSVDKLMSALAVMYMYVGAPCIYYGTEIALEGNFDPDSRRTFDWEKAKKETKLTSLIKTLTALKHGDNLTDATIKIYEKNELVFIERKGLKLVVNQSGREAKYIADDIVESNNYSAKCLSDNGFVIEKTH